MKAVLKTIISTIILFASIGIVAQRPQTKLNQLELYKQFIGTWQAEIGADSIEVRECREYGMSFVIDVYQVIKGKKIPVYINNISFDSNEGKFKGFLLYPNGGYFTWIGKFTKNNYFSGNIVFNFMPEVAWSDFHNSIISPTEFTCSNFNQQSQITTEMKFIKMN
ncbi:MAG: hypothetical protein FD181_3558 [Prolixibacteraceae bacterium]|nr:MAG: hypothetical protein FD181_3558 [Prolixibacteraceae bacterium]